MYVKMFNLKCVILIVCITNGNMNGEVKHIKLIVKIKKGFFPIVENVTLRKNFTIFRKISDELYTLTTTISDDQTQFPFNTVIQELHAELIDQVEYLYEDYSIFEHLPVVVGAVAGHNGFETTTLSLQVEKSYEVCTPVYDKEYGIDDAWQRNFTGKGIVIAIIDVGVDRDHPQLRRNIDTRLSRNIVDDNSNFEPQYFAGVHTSARWTKLSSRYQKSQQQLPAMWMWGRSRLYDSWATEKAEQLKVTYVFPAGEPGNSFVNNIFTIAIGDTGVNGSLPDNPNVNSATLLSMFGQGRSKSDSRMIVYMHTEGIRSKRPCTKEFGGQSATCAMMAGVIAEFIGVNPQLTSRDVKHILVESAFKTGLVEETSFKQNRAGYFYHSVLGFKLPNVTRMIELAINWTPPSNLISQSFVFNISRNSNEADAILPTEKIAKIEQIEITVSFNFPKNTNLSMAITSPHNTTSWLFANIVLSEDSYLDNVVFLSNHFWGEDPLGQWTLQILGANAAEVAITRANITIHGTGNEKQSQSLSETSMERNYSIPVSEFQDNDTYINHTDTTSHSNFTDSKPDNKTLVVILVVLLVLVLVCVVAVVVWKCKTYKSSSQDQTVRYSDLSPNDN